MDKEAEVKKILLRLDPDGRYDEAGIDVDAKEICQLFERPSSPPPVLSDDEKALAVHEWLEKTKDNPDAMPDYSDIIAQAQRDADVEYYRPT